MGRRIETIAAILGVLIVGRGFAPISNNQPPSRILACLGEVQSAFLLNGLGSDEKAAIDKKCLLDSSKKEINLSDLKVSVSGEDLLYILFTSGSSGSPKGVMCSHNNILNTIQWGKSQIAWNADDCIGIASYFSFDISMFDVFVGLFNSVSMHIFDKPNNKDEIIDQINQRNVTSIFSVPFFFTQFSRQNYLGKIKSTSLRRVISGGDFFSPLDLLDWFVNCPNIELFNVWGPTETSIVNTMHKVTEKDVKMLESGQCVSVGTSHALMEFLLIEPDERDVILSKNNRGEIAMLGPCVSIGYLNNEELNNNKYFFYEGKRGFRTGDLGRLDNGDLFIEGRIGSQVKIGGHRVELAEVEAAVSSIPDVFMSAAFVVETVPGLNEIWCCIQTKPEIHRANIFALKQSVRNKVPYYMVPKRFFQLNNLPLNANNKIDRNEARKIVLQENEKF